MKKYNVNVNGTMYEITVEVADAAEVKSAVSSAAPASAPVAAAAAPAPKAASGGEAVSAPMPGTILSVNVKPGASVKKGDVLFILEAMKMENEIVAPCSGTVSQVVVSQGNTVDTDAVLAFIG